MRPVDIGKIFVRKAREKQRTKKKRKERERETNGKQNVVDPLQETQTNKL